MSEAIGYSLNYQGQEDGRESPRIEGTLDESEAPAEARYTHERV